MPTIKRTPTLATEDDGYPNQLYRWPDVAITGLPVSSPANRPRSRLPKMLPMPNN